MPTILDFLVEQSSLGSGSTVAELINNPRPTLDESGIQVGLVSPASDIGLGGTISGASISEADVISEGSVDTGSIAPAGTIDPAS